MINLKTVLVVSALIAMCYGDHVDKYYKKKHHHHHGVHHHFLYYLTFLAIKLKIVFFLGTIFTIGMVAAKVVGIIKLTEYMKHKYHHEEKIVYINPHEHHDHTYGGYSGGYASPSDIISSKTYPSYSPDFSVDQPPDSDQYGYGPGPEQYPSDKSSSRDIKGSYGSGIYSQLLTIASRLRQFNITDMAFHEMGIKDEHCKKKFVCKADYMAQNNVILSTGFNILRDDSYQKYKPNTTITSEEECESLHQQCRDHID